MPSTPDKKSVLVAGSTGRLGVVADLLLARGHAVRAMTREPDGAAARRLRDAGADVLYGDFDDPDSVAAAAGGADALFATGTAHRTGPAGEQRHGHNLADAAASAGVGHLVYSSGDGAASDSPLPLFAGKYSVEQHIRSLPIRHTILAPVYFMENLLNPWNLPALKAGVFPSPIPVDTPLQQVALADVARYAVLAIERPEDFAGRRIPLASDQLTARTAAAQLSRLIGRRLEPRQAPSDTLGPGLRALFEWLATVGHDVDIAALRGRHPEVGWHDYRAWLESQRGRLHGLCPRREPVAG